MKRLTFLFCALMWVAVFPAWAAPTLTVHPERLIYECETGRSYYQSFTVSATDLTEDLTLTMFGDTHTFMMDRTTITAQEAMAGVTVKVRYAPMADGEYEGRIWITSSEVKGSVLLKGTTAALPYIVTDTTELYLTCPSEGIASATFNVTGGNLEESIWLILEDHPSGAFSLDRTSIPLNQTGDTTTVTVFYRPQEVGCDTTTILVWSHYANDIIIKLYGMATPSERNYYLMCMADVLDVEKGEREGEYELTPAQPSRCGHLATCQDAGGSIVLNWHNGLMYMMVDRDNMTARMYYNSSQETATSIDGSLKTTTVTRYYLDGAECLDDLQHGPYDVEGRIRADGSIAFDDFVVTSVREVTVVNTMTNKVVSTSTTQSTQLYRNMVLAKPNGTHRYSTPPEPDPGTVSPMANIAPGGNSFIDPTVIPFNQRFAQVYIEQQEDTVMVWNLYNMGGCNRIVLDNGFFDWAWQACGYKDDGGCWYNYTPYRSYTPEGEVMLTVVTYLHRLRGVKGKATASALTWGNTTFGDGNGLWSTSTFCDNVLSYNSGEEAFVCEETQWSVDDLAQLVDGLLTEDPVLLTHPASDPNDDGQVDLGDITSLIDILLTKTR